MATKSTLAQIFGALMLIFAPQNCAAETTLVAVSANFSETIELLQSKFEAENEHQLIVVTGSTGKLYAQIMNGAPFDVFLAADQARPALLIENGRAVPESLITYATGQLVLWSADAEMVLDETILSTDFRRLAIANPALAPYGLAAVETLEKLGRLEQLEDKIVMGENIGQTHALVASGNAELGFVALAYATSARNSTVGSFWRVPSEFHEPIHQDAVLLSHALNNAAATAFLEFLKSSAAMEIIEKKGYEVE